MNPITVTDQKQKTIWLGKKLPPLFGSASLGIKPPSERLGAAFAFKVNWGDTFQIRILYTRIYLKRNSNHPVTIRCSISPVDPRTNMPSYNFFPQTIDISISKEKGWATCDFQNQNLYIDNDEFFVVFEWMTREEERIVPRVATGRFFKSDTYIRHHALDEWEKSSVNLIYSVKVAY